MAENTGSTTDMTVDSNTTIPIHRKANNSLLDCADDLKKICATIKNVNDDGLGDSTDAHEFNRQLEKPSVVTQCSEVLDGVMKKHQARMDTVETQVQTLLLTMQDVMAAMPVALKSLRKDVDKMQEEQRRLKALQNMGGSNASSCQFVEAPMAEDFAQLEAYVYETQSKMRQDMQDQEDRLLARMGCKQTPRGGVMPNMEAIAEQLNQFAAVHLKDHRTLPSAKSVSSARPMIGRPSARGAESPMAPGPLTGRPSARGAESPMAPGPLTGESPWAPRGAESPWAPFRQAMAGGPLIGWPSARSAEPPWAPRGAESPWLTGRDDRGTGAALIMHQQSPPDDPTAAYLMRQHSQPVMRRQSAPQQPTIAIQTAEAPDRRVAREMSPPAGYQTFSSRGQTGASSPWRPSAQGPYRPGEDRNRREGVMTPGSSRGVTTPVTETGHTMRRPMARSNTAAMIAERSPQLSGQPPMRSVSPERSPTRQSQPRFSDILPATRAMTPASSFRPSGTSSFETPSGNEAMRNIIAAYPNVLR